MQHNQYPGTTTNKQEAVFNELANHPDFQLDDLAAGQAVSITPDSEIFTDANRSSKVLALIRVPTTGQENAYLLLGERPEGYFLTSKEADDDQLDMDLDSARDMSEAPIELGKKPDTRLVVGRAGFVVTLPGSAPMSLGTRFGRKIRESFGEQTSREHFGLSITADGIVITGMSGNLTGILHKKMPEQPEQ